MQPNDGRTMSGFREVASNSITHQFLQHRQIIRLCED